MSVSGSFDHDLGDTESEKIDGHFGTRRLHHMVCLLHVRKHCGLHIGMVEVFRKQLSPLGRSLYLASIERSRYEPYYHVC